MAKRSVEHSVDDERLPYCLVAWPERGGLEVLFNRQYEPIWQRMPGCAAEPANPDERIARWGNRWFYDECCGTPRRPPPRKSQETQALLQAALVLFIAGKDVSQLLLPKGPIPGPVRRRYQFGKAETDI
jgi:hypothetical protein